MQIYIVILILAAAIAYAAWTIARAIRQKDPCCGCESKKNCQKFCQSKK